MRFILPIVLMAALAFPAGAYEPDEVLDDPVLEQRARDLSAELRCLVCQNQSIDDSDAPLAKDLRVLVRERLTAGDTNEEVKSFIVQRYGEFVLLKPYFGLHTLLLWSLPFVLFVLGALLIFRRRTRPAEQSAPQELSKDEQARLDKLLKD
ncbi:MAG: cytochrome c-type biogenesis protein [Hyphomicrobiales bacterium]